MVLTKVKEKAEDSVKHHVYKEMNVLSKMAPLAFIQRVYAEQVAKGESAGSVLRSLKLVDI